MRILAQCILVLGTAAAAAHAQVAMPDLGAGQATYFFEATDRGVAATGSYRRSNMHAATPLTIPGGRMVKTLELKRLMDTTPGLVVVDVLDSQNRASLPGAAWLPEGGKAFGSGADRSKFETALQTLTGNDKARPVVFLCSGADCWLSYNAALMAIELGYKDVLWYRGGTNAWQGANLETTRAKAL